MAMSVPQLTQATVMSRTPVDPGYGQAPYPVDPGYGACTYVVQPGDSFSWIAKVNGTTVWELQQLNGLANPNFIYVGQVLTLPGCGGSMPLPPGCVEPCGGPVDRCPACAPARPAVAVWTPAALRRPGPTRSSRATRSAALPPGSGWITTPSARSNGIHNPNIIYVGQVLIIP